MRLYIINIFMICFFVHANAFETSNMIFQNDTINQRDNNKLKQGWWVIYDKEKNYKKEEGRYLNNRKTGIWKAYYESGKLKNKITYKRGRADGYAIMYYENGEVSEEGIWKMNKWVGDYKFYHKNGNIAYDWKYNKSGKRTGEQKYYYDNGELMIEGKWENGKEKGVIKEYYADGSPKSEKYFNDGKIDATKVKIYNKGQQVNNNDNSNNDNVVVEDNNNNNNNEPISFFNGTGENKVYKKVAGERKLYKEGYFVDGKLQNGKKYTYDLETAQLVKITIYKNGKIVNIKYPD